MTKFKYAEGRITESLQFIAGELKDFNFKTIETNFKPGKINN